METDLFNQLLQKIKYDVSAIESIYQEYMPSVRLHVASRFGNAVDADDVAHEVFMKLMLIDWSKYKPVKSPNAWLNTIADNIALDSIKKNHVDYPIENYENSLYYFQVDELLIADDVKFALKFLDKREATIIYLNKYEGYRFKDIATFLSMSPIAVRVAASRAYKKLKKICNKYHIEFV